MAKLNLSFDDLASVICLACHLANADGDFSEVEMKAIVGAIADQYDFDGQEDLLRRYFEVANKMNPMEAVRHIADFGPVEKQWASNFFVKTIVADDNLEENEKSLYWDIMDKCGLPDHNLQGDSQSNAPKEVPLSTQVCISFTPHLVDGDVYDTIVDFVEFPFDQENIREDLFEWFRKPESLQFCRKSDVLADMNQKFGLQNGWHFLLVYAKRDHWLHPGLNQAGIMIDGEDTVYGPALLLLEGEGKVAKGFMYESFISSILTHLYNTDNNFLIAGENVPELTRRYVVTALSALQFIPKQ